MQQYFWQKFQGVCETRWRISRSSDNEDTALFEKYEKKKEGVKKVEAIGATISDFKTLFEADVEDTITGEKIYSKSTLVDGADKGTTIEMLLSEGVNARDAYIEKLREKISGMVENSVGVVKDALQHRVDVGML